VTRPRSFRDDLSESRSLGSVHRMPIKLENVGIAVRDLEATIAFFTDLGLTVLGRDTVSGEWTDTAVGLDGNHANIAMLQAPAGNGRLELFEYIHPDAIETEPTQPNEIGMHRVAFSVDDIDESLEIAARHDCHPLRGVATYGDAYKLTYVRGPSGIIVMLAEELKKRSILSSGARQGTSAIWNAVAGVRPSAAIDAHCRPPPGPLAAAERTWPWRHLPDSRSPSSGPR
jgi:glyoxylase I family protein